MSPLGPMGPAGPCAPGDPAGPIDPLADGARSLEAMEPFLMSLPVSVPFLTCRPVMRLAAVAVAVVQRRAVRATAITVRIRTGVAAEALSVKGWLCLA